MVANVGVVEAVGWIGAKQRQRDAGNNIARTWLRRNAHDLARSHYISDDFTQERKPRRRGSVRFVACIGSCFSREIHGAANMASICMHHLALLPALGSSQRCPAGRAARGIIPGRRADFPACSLHRPILAPSLERARSCYTHLNQLEGRLQNTGAGNRVIFRTRR